MAWRGTGVACLGRAAWLYGAGRGRGFREFGCGTVRGRAGPVCGLCGSVCGGRAAGNRIRAGGGESGLPPPRPISRPLSRPSRPRGCTDKGASDALAFIAQDWRGGRRVCHHYAGEHLYLHRDAAATHARARPGLPPTHFQKSSPGHRGPSDVSPPHCTPGGGRRGPTPAVEQQEPPGPHPGRPHSGRAADTQKYDK